jgi:GNAT superfamily N-acetyltransferase
VQDAAVVIEFAEPASPRHDWAVSASAQLGGPRIVGAIGLCDLREMPVRVALRDGCETGFVASVVSDTCAEVVAILSDPTGHGIGSALMAAVETDARKHGRAALCVATTNDNLGALGFYQRLGFVITDHRVGGFSEILRLKGLDPSQEVIGQNGIVIRDHIVLTKAL